jgi:mono/diheme cytochrome c family protein
MDRSRRVLMATVLFSATVGLAIASSSAFFPFVSNRIDIHAGQAIYRKRCAVCHPLLANQPGLGPSLENIADVGGTRREGIDAIEYMIESIVAPSAFAAPGDFGEMPAAVAADMSVGEVLDVVAFLCSRSGSVPYRRILSLAERARPVASGQAVVIDVEKAERGRMVFLQRAKCPQCHSLDPLPGSDLLAPVLAGVGRHSREYISDALRHPSKTILPGYESWTVMKDGIPSTGRRLESRGDGSVLLASEGKAGGFSITEFSIDQLDVDDDGAPLISKSRVSPMPPVEESLSESQIDDLIEFLTTLR